MLNSKNRFLTLVLLSLLIASGCGQNESGTEPGAGKQADSGLEDKVVVYSPHGKEILGEFKELFEKEHPGTTVEFLYLSSQQCLERVRNEKVNPLADVWWGASHTTFMTAAEEGLLEPYAPTWANRVGQEQHDAEDRWYATFLSPEIIFYNADTVSADEAPTDWMDLADPKYKDRLILRFPIPSDTMRTIFFGIIDRSLKGTGDVEKAFEWMKGVDANTKEYLNGGEQVFRKMAQRVGDISMWTLSDIMLQKSKYDYPFEIVYPQSGSPVILDGIALVKGCQHPEAAKAYYEFVTSTTSAARLANEPYYRIPTRKDIPEKDLPDWMGDLQYTSQELDWDLYREKMNDWMQRWDTEIKGQG
ncbi:MAG: extracellular solute-binding protein [Candidatus Omnitrophica bacterium]|nr:extracellular solute-binding protein [Candidatus Omnitrophota bacterium]